MIRKLKVGEVIREGDFITGTDNPNDDRFHFTKYNLGLEALTASTIFREIPDSHTVKFKTGAEITKSADWHLGVHTKDSLKAYGEWLLEISEAME